MAFRASFQSRKQTSRKEWKKQRRPPSSGRIEKSNSRSNVRTRKKKKGMRIARKRRYEQAVLLQLSIIQVLNDGSLATVLNDNYKTIFIELKGSHLAQGQRYELKAEQWGTFKYRTVLGAPSVVERWAPVDEPD
jgi:hypothetical protein